MKLLTGQGLLMLFRIFIMSFIMGRGRQLARQFTCAHLALSSPGQKRTSAARASTVSTLTRILLSETVTTGVFFVTQPATFILFIRPSFVLPWKFPHVWRGTATPPRLKALWRGARGQNQLLTVCRVRSDYWTLQIWVTVARADFHAYKV